MNVDYSEVYALMLDRINIWEAEFGKILMTIAKASLTSIDKDIKGY